MCSVLEMVAITLYDKLTLANFNSLASSLAYMTAAYVGIKGLNAWKAQLKGNQDYNLAKSLMLNIYKYQEAMNHLRSPAIWTSEYPIFSQEELNLPQNMRRYKQISHVYQKRWEKIGDARPGIFEKTLEAQVLWGEEIRCLIDDLLKLEKKVIIAFGNYLEVLNPDCYDSAIDKDDRSWIYDCQNDEVDVYRKPFKERLRAIEEYLKTKLKL